MPANQFSTIFKAFLKNTIILTLILALIYVLLIFSIPNKYLSPAIPAILFFFVAITVALFYYQIKASLKRTSKFVNFFLLATALKLLLFLFLVLAYALLNKSDAVNFIFSFFIIYFVYSIFEVIQILKFQDQISQKKD